MTGLKFFLIRFSYGLFDSQIDIIKIVTIANIKTFAFGPFSNLQAIIIQPMYALNIYEKKNFNINENNG